MEPGAAETAAQLCEQLIADLDTVRARARNLVVYGGMGDCLVVNQLAQKFTDKAIGDRNSLVHVITKHQEVLAAMAETYRRAGHAVIQQDTATESAFRS